MALKSKRVKGETVTPVAALTLVGKIGVTRAAKETGTSTTTLHKARKTGVISKVVEMAAKGVLEHLGDMPDKPAKVTPPAPAKAASRGTTMFLLEVSNDKADIVVRLAEALQAELIAA